MRSMTTLIFGSEASEYVRASFGDRPYVDSEHAFDRNQVAVQLELFVRPSRLPLARRGTSIVSSSSGRILNASTRALMEKHDFFLTTTAPWR